MTFHKQVQRLVTLRAEIAQKEKEAKAAIDPMKVERDTIQAEILAVLQKTGQFSARFEEATVTRAVRKTPQVVDEQKVVSYLEANGLADEYVSRRLNDSFEALAKKAMKDNIEIDGVEIRETEYLSLSAANPDKEEHRKVVTEQFVPVTA